MHCSRCHHADSAHSQSPQGSSIMQLGACAVPGCACGQYRDPIQKIDEELL